MAMVKLDEVCQKVFGITTRRYRYLAAEGIVPKPEKNQIDFVLACKALIEYYRKLAQGQGGVSLAEERARLTKIQADRKELQLKKEKGELIPVDEAMKEWINALQKVRQKLLAIPIKASPLVIASKNTKEAKEILENFIYEALEEIANQERKKK